MGSNRMHCTECRRSNPTIINDEHWECSVCGLQLEQTEDNQNLSWVNHEDPNGAGRNTISKGSKMTGSTFTIDPNDLRSLSSEDRARFYRMKRWDDRSASKMLGTRVRRNVRDTIRRTYLDQPQMQTLCIDLFDVGWPEPGTAPKAKPMWLAAHPHGRAASRVAVHLMAAEILAIRIDDKISFTHQIFLEESDVPPNGAKEAWKFTQKAMRQLRTNHRLIRGKNAVPQDSVRGARMCLDQAIEYHSPLLLHRKTILNAISAWGKVNDRVLVVPRNYLSVIAHLLIENDGEKVNSNLITKAFGGSRQYLKHLDEGRIILGSISASEVISQRD